MAKKNKVEAPVVETAAPEEKKHSKGFLAIMGILAVVGSALVVVLGAVLSVVGSALVVVLGAVLYMVNPWYIPQILKRNYPEWFEAHPLISRFIPLT